MSRSDEELAGDFVKGDAAAFTELANRHRSDLVIYLTNRLRGDVNLAEDTTQLVLMGAHRCLPTFDTTRCFKSWLYAIADHRGKDAARSAARRKKRTVNITDVVCDNVMNQDQQDELTADLMCETSSDIAERNELAGLVPEMLRDLPQPQRDAVNAVVIEGMSSRAAESILGVGYKSIQKRVKQGLEMLRRNFSVPTELAPAN